MRDDRHRNDQRGGWFNAARGDIEQGWRAVWRRPVLSIVLVFTLGIGQAVSASLFAVVDGLLLKSLPFRDPSGLYVVGPRSQLRPDLPSSVRPEQLDLFARHPLVKGAFGSCSGYGFFEHEYADAEHLRDSSVTTQFFEVLGVMPMLGRPLRAADAVRTEPRPAVISEGLWRSRFGGDPRIIESTVVLGNRRITVVGVMPRGFDFPRGTNVWLADVPNNNMAYLTAVVRVAPRDGPPRLSMSLGRDTCTIRPLRAFFEPTGAGSVLALFLATGITVVIAWIHVGGLQMALALARAREVAIRLALGARLAHVVRQWLVETSILCGMAFVGAGLAVPAFLALFLHLLPAETTLGQPISIDWRTLTFLGALTAFGSVALSMGPVAVLRQTRINDVLHGGLPALGVASVARARWGLLAVQVGLLTAVLYVAGLAVLSLNRLNRTDVGFRTSDLLQVDLPRSPSDASARALFAQLQERVSALPSVVAVAQGAIPLLAGRMPVSILATAPEHLEDLERRDGLQWWVSQGYFRTIGARITEGSDSDLGSKPDATVLSETARKLLRLGRPAVGKHVYIGGGLYTVVGVVADVRAYGPEQPPAPYVYVARPEAAMVIRSVGPAENAVPEVLGAVRQVTGETRPVKITLASALAAQATAGPRSRSILLSVLGIASLALAMVAIFSTTNEAVRRRLKDIAVRMVLGADPARIVRQTIGRTLRVVSAGLVFGLMIGIAIARWASTLFVAAPGVRWEAACAVFLVLLGSAGIAALAPAYRAGRTDPLTALRHE